MKRLSRRAFLKAGGSLLTAAGMASLSRRAALAATYPFTPTEPPVAPRPEIPADEMAFLAAHELIEGDTVRKVVLMTYDDAQADAPLAHLLDVYREYSVKCAFFFVGLDLEKSRATLPRLVAEGHDLGCHGWEHAGFPVMSDDAIHRQFGKFFAKVHEIVPGYRVRYFRAPYGDRNQRVRDLAAQWGMQHVLWSYESGGLDKDTVHYVIDRAVNGSIFLSHAHRPYDVSEADVIVRELVRRGFSLENLTTGMAAKDRWPAA